MSKHQVITIIFVAALFILWCLKQAVVVNPLWYVVLGMGYLACNAYGAVVLSTQYFTPVKWKAPHARGIALTFDDGPVPGHTEEILNILKTHGIKATFFCIGHRVNSYPEIAQRIHEEGHLLANHSYWHSKTFDLQSSGKMLKELRDTDAAINTHV